MLKATVEKEFKAVGLRMVGFQREEDDFGDLIYLAHPHIMDLYHNQTQIDPLIDRLKTLDMRVAYSAKRNAFVMKEN
jgi:hypothetical protein